MRLKITQDSELPGFVTAFEQARADAQAMGMFAACRNLGNFLGYHDRRSRTGWGATGVSLACWVDEVSDEELSPMAKSNVGGFWHSLLKLYRERMGGAQVVGVFGGQKR